MQLINIINVNYLIYKMLHGDSHVYLIIMLFSLCLINEKHMSATLTAVVMWCLVNVYG